MYEKLDILPMLPIVLTENSKSKAIRVIGVVAYFFWVFPVMFLWLFIMVLLIIPTRLYCSGRVLIRNSSIRNS